jgi:serine phosphatase RsbU (regulator of sigma subunit)
MARGGGAGLALGLCLLGLIVTADVILDSEAAAIVGSYVAAPFVTALVGGPRATAFVALVALALAVASPTWNMNAGGADQAVRIALVGAGGLVAVAGSYYQLRSRSRSQRLWLLDAVGAVADGSLPLSETLNRVTEVIVPAVGDICMVDAVRDGRVNRIATRVRGSGDDEVIEERLRQRPPTLPRWLVEGERSWRHIPRWVAKVSDEEVRRMAHSPEDREFLRSLGIRSSIVVPIRARNRNLGTLSLLTTSWSGRRYTEDDVRFAQILSGRMGLALDNAGLFSDLERAEQARAEIAETLQRGLLPPPLPSIPGWTVAAMYRPAGAENEVGGDFYDVFRVAGGWMLVIGDVTGRGAEAASITAVARYTLRTAAALTADPLVALNALNRALLARGDAALCSVVAMVLSEDPERPVRLAVAGHPPPLLVDPAGVREVGGEDPVLGAFGDATWAIETCAIESGQQLVVFTDGITESIGSQGRFGEQRLRDELRGIVSPALALARLESSLNAFTEGVLVDDVAILALARAAGGSEPIGGPQPQDSPSLAIGHGG